MKLLSKTILPILSISTLFIFTACSKPEVVAVSDAHLYNQNFGLVNNYEADEAIQEEYISMNLPTQVDMPLINDPEISTELVKDPDAFYAHEYVPTPPVITYKYEFDPKFYDTPEWRKMDLQ